MHDLKFALRQLVKSPGFTAVAVLTLALGIGASTALFSVVNAVVLRPLPYPEPARLVHCNWLLSPAQGEIPSVTSLVFEYWRDHTTSFEASAAYAGLNSGFNLSGGREPQRVVGLQVSRDFFRVLGVGPVQGRDFLPEEDRPGGPDSVVISDRLWRSTFGADPDVVGQTATINGRPHEIVGILPPHFQFQQPADLFLPLKLRPNPRDNGQNTAMIARLKPGVTLEQAQADVARPLDAFRAEYPAHLQPDERGMWLVPYQQAVVGTSGRTLWLLLGASGFVLLIACANVANLLLARATARKGEIALRLALGASRGRIVRQLLTESLLLALAGSLAGFLVAQWSLPALLAFAPRSLPRLAELTLDHRVGLFAVATALATTVLFGLLPAWRAVRLDVTDAFKGTSRRASAGRADSRVRALLVAGEAALAVVLLIGAGLFIRSFLKLRDVETGFDLHDVTTMQVSLTSERYRTTAQVSAFESEVRARIAALPGVTAVATASNVPLERGLNIGMQFDEEGGPAWRTVELRSISPQYFQVLGIPLLRGRAFTEADTADASPVVIVNETLARQQWPGRDPVGEQVTWQGRRVQVVAVARDIKEIGLDRAVRPTAYVPLAQVPDSTMRVMNGWFLTSWLVRTAGPVDLAAGLRAAVQAADPQLPVATLRPLTQVLEASLQARSFLLRLMSTFAGLALLLSAIGIYGVLNYQVGLRVNEMGIRMALGAQAADVIRLVISQGMRSVLAGIALGLAVSAALTRLIASQLFAVTPNDPFTFIAITLLLLGVALAACWLPARRATKIDPMTALRAE